MTATDATVGAIADVIRQRRRFLVTSHVRPDGDAIGSSMAMALALRCLGKDVRVVMRDPAPPPMAAFAGVSEIELATRVDDAADAVLVMECGDLARTGLDGLADAFLINVDHHDGNTRFGALNWLDLSAAACGEMVFDLIRALGVPLSREMAEHVYLAVLTDTGSFRHSHITARTFEVCRACAEAGVDAAALARTVYDSYPLARLKLAAAVLNRMELDETGRVAVISVDRAQAAAYGASYEDTEGLINQPLTVKEIQAVVFFKEQGPGDWRVSLRSKGDIDVSAIARQFGGGGHRNAAGCSATGTLPELATRFRELVAQAAGDT